MKFQIGHGFYKIISLAEYCELMHSDNPTHHASLYRQKAARLKEGETLHLKACYGFGKVGRNWVCIMSDFQRAAELNDL